MSAARLFKRLAARSFHVQASQRGERELRADFIGDEMWGKPVNEGDRPALMRLGSSRCPLTIKSPGGGGRQDRIHFSRLEGAILSITTVPGVSTKYPEAFVLRRLDALALAQLLDDRIFAGMHLPAEERAFGRTVIWRGGIDVALKITDMNLVVLGFCNSDSRPVIKVTIRPETTVDLINWLRNQFSQGGLERSKGRARHKALNRAIGRSELTL